MARDVTLKELTYQQAGRFLSWADQETGSTATNGTPTVDVSGVDVSGLQVCKLGIDPVGGAVLDFRIWIQYDGLSKFVLVDGSDREGISTAWTQELNVAGVSRVYVEITSISAGEYSVHVGKALALAGEAAVGRKITDWADAGTGLFDGQRLIYEDVNGNEAIFEWDDTNAYWVVRSTFGDRVCIENWSSGTVRTSLWTVDQNTDPGAVSVGVSDGSSGDTRLKITGTNGTQEKYVIQTDSSIRIPPNTEIYAEMERVAAATGDFRIDLFAMDMDADGDNEPHSLSRLFSGTGVEWLAQTRAEGGATTTSSSFSAALDTTYVASVSHQVWFNATTGFETVAVLEDTGGSVLADETGGLSESLGSTPTQGYIQLTIESLATDEACTLEVGKIWIRK